MKTTIGTHCTVTSSKRFRLSERAESGVPFFCSKQIIQLENGEIPSDYDHITNEHFRDIQIKYGVPSAGDLLITTRGTYGIPYIYKERDCFYFADGNLTWLKDFDDCLSSHYLYYWFKSYEGQKKIDAIAKGTAQKAVPIALIKDLQLSLPPISQQKRIASILSAYDDLIENNRRQIKLLEEAAQRLYREWFVELRFPGHESVKVVDGVPEGWKIETVGSLLRKIPRTKQVLTSDYQVSGNIPIVDQSRDFIAGYTNDTDACVKPQDAIIVFGDHTRILKYITFPFAKGADGTQLIVSNSDCMPQSLFYFSIIHIDLTNYHYARHFKYLKESTILVPTKSIANAYDNIVHPIMKRIQVLRNSCVKAKEVRDRLLPKLMSGEMEV